MKYAVIRLQGHQYKVTEGQEFTVDLLDKKPEAEVLLLVDGEKVIVGNPTLKSTSVKLSAIGDLKGEKIEVIKFKAKSRYSRHTGFRSKLTSLKVDKITVSI